MRWQPCRGGRCGGLGAGLSHALTSLPVLCACAGKASYSIKLSWRTAPLALLRGWRSCWALGAAEMVRGCSKSTATRHLGWLLVLIMHSISRTLTPHQVPAPPWRKPCAWDRCLSGGCLQQASAMHPAAQPPLLGRFFVLCSKPARAPLPSATQAVPAWSTPSPGRHAVHQGLSQADQATASSAPPQGTDGSAASGAVKAPGLDASSQHKGAHQSYTSPAQGHTAVGPSILAPKHCKHTAASKHLGACTFPGRGHERNLQKGREPLRMAPRSIPGAVQEQILNETLHQELGGFTAAAQRSPSRDLGMHSQSSSQEERRSQPGSFLQSSQVCPSAQSFAAHIHMSMLTPGGLGFQGMSCGPVQEQAACSSAEVCLQVQSSHAQWGAC